jgi:hypothetical protein
MCIYHPKWFILCILSSIQSKKFYDLFFVTLADKKQLLQCCAVFGTCSKRILKKLRGLAMV